MVFVVDVRRVKLELSEMCNFWFSTLFFAQLTKGRFGFVILEKFGFLAENLVF